MLHPESSPTAELDPTTAGMLFISQNWACYEEQFDFKQAVEEAEK
jgi:hypothetical protein